MNRTYKKLLKALHEKYPERHISIELANSYYDHSNEYKIEYYVYITGICGKHFSTLSQLRACVDHLCKKES